MFVTGEKLQVCSDDCCKLGIVRDCNTFNHRVDVELENEDAPMQRFYWSPTQLCFKLAGDLVGQFHLTRRSL
jgi:hypothetical protein